MRFALKDSDRLVLISDGIIEVKDAEGRLFGFDRIQALLHSPVSTAAIADAAQSFGQEDDISVIAITRTAVLNPTLV